MQLRKKYAQIDKEGLAIIYGVTKFRTYLYGRPFVIESDHKPLSYLFSESRGIPEQASSRIQRWALDTVGISVQYPLQSWKGPQQC